jgi:hypothetical protein
MPAGPARPDSNLNAQLAPTARGRSGPHVNSAALADCSERVVTQNLTVMMKSAAGPQGRPMAL